MSQFDPAEFSLWWILPLSGVLIALAGLGMVVFLFGTDPGKQPFVSMASFQNTVYIVLPIVQLVYPDQFDRLALFCFLLILGQSPIMWSVGKVLVSGNGLKLSCGRIFSPRPWLPLWRPYFWRFPEPQPCCPKTCFLPWIF